MHLISFKNLLTLVLIYLLNLLNHVIFYYSPPPKMYHLMQMNLYLHEMYSHLHLHLPISPSLMYYTQTPNPMSYYSTKNYLTVLLLILSIMSPNHFLLIFFLLSPYVPISISPNSLYSLIVIHIYLYNPKPLILMLLSISNFIHMSPLIIIFLISNIPPSSQTLPSHSI